MTVVEHSKLSAIMHWCDIIKKMLINDADKVYLIEQLLTFNLIMCNLFALVFRKIIIDKY